MKKPLGIVTASLIALAVTYWAWRPYIAVPQPVAASTTPTPASDKPATAQPSVNAAPAPAPRKASPGDAVLKTPNKLTKGHPELTARLDAMQQRRPNQRFDADAVAAAVERDYAWTPAEKAASELPLSEADKNDGRQFIHFDPLKLETLMPGDTMTVAVEETATQYQVVVDRVEKHDYNSITWHGHVDGGDSQGYSVSFTRGEHLTVGGLSTPDGHYVLQAHGDDGWIASSALLFKYDPDVPDVMYPDAEGADTSLPH